MQQGVKYYGVESSVMMMMMMIKNLHRMQSVFGNLENAESVGESFLSTGLVRSRDGKVGVQ